MTNERLLLKQVAEAARDLLAEHGLTDWQFAYDKAVKRAGQCKYVTKTISLSYHYVLRNIDRDAAEVLDTILHEIAHALAGPRTGHGPEWQAMCLKVGAIPQRCCGMDVDMPKGQYQAVCVTCSKVYHKHKRPRLGSGRYYYCRQCGKDAGKLEFKQS